jgi:LmbE family N-acetylglucosaminyl deacetylase
MTNSSNLRLMAILAHPDDESMAIGGTLARYAAEGVDVTLITATRGQRGWPGAPADYPGPDSLGRRREGELRAAARVLGLSEVVTLDYMDGDLDQAHPEQIACDLVAHIRRVRPDVVLTWGPDGGYGHPDHVAIGEFATAAVMRAADPRSGHRCPTRAPHSVSKFFHIAWSPRTAAAFTYAFGDLHIEVDGVIRRPVITPDWLVRARVDTRMFARTAWQAIACHRSQLPDYARLSGLPDEQHRRLWGHNDFCRVFSTVSGRRADENDLFAGLREEAAEVDELADAA